MQTILAAIVFVLALGYIGYRLRKQFTAQSCGKGCGGSCEKINITNNVK